MTTLAQYSAARAALAEASRVDQVLHVRDEVEHLKLYSRQIKDRSLMADALELQLRCERRLGQLLVAAKEMGQVSRGQPKKNCTDEEQFSRVRLEDAGIDRKLSSKAQKAAKLSEQAFAAMVEQARNRLAGTAAKPINANQHQSPTVEQPSNLENHDTSGLWRSRLRELISDIDVHLDVAPSHVDRAYGLKRLDAKWKALPPHDETTGEIMSDVAAGEDVAGQSNSMADVSQSFKSGMLQPDSGPVAKVAPPSVIGPESFLRRAT